MCKLFQCLLLFSDFVSIKCVFLSYKKHKYMPLKLFILLIFTYLLTFSLPLNANVCRQNIPAIHQPKTHFPPHKGIDGTTILAIFLCVMAGSMGIHRVVMGGSPWLIVAYTFTFGGFFLLLPFMDFVRMLSEPEHYKNNHKFLAAFGLM